MSKSLPFRQRTCARIGARKAPRRKPSPGRLIKYAISGSRVALICVLCLVSTKMSLTSTEKCDDGDTFCRAILALGCAHLLSHLRRFRSRGKSRALPLPHLRCTRLLVSCFWVPRDACHIFSCDTARFQLVCWHVVAGHCPLHRCRMLKAKFATGATGQPRQMPHH